MKFLLAILLAYVPVTNTVTAANADDYLEPLRIIETIMGNRRTNVGRHETLYPDLDLGLAVNCHPYNPTDVEGENAPVYQANPLIVKYTSPLCQDFLPEFIRGRLNSGPPCQLFLNVQNNPWNGTPIELRPHAFSDFFPLMGGNYQGVLAQVHRDDGTILHQSTGSVHLHDGIASPDNFLINGLDHTQNQAFYSIVTYDGRSVATRHLLLTVPTCGIFQDLLCAPTVYDRSPNFFAMLLGANYPDFLQHYDVI